MKHLLLTLLVITTPVSATDIITAAKCKVAVAQLTVPGSAEAKQMQEACYGGNANVKHALENMRDRDQSVTVNVQSEVQLNGIGAAQGAHPYSTIEPYTANERARLYPYSFGPAIQPRR